MRATIGKRLARRNIGRGLVPRRAARSRWAGDEPPPYAREEGTSSPSARASKTGLHRRCEVDQAAAGGEGAAGEEGGVLHGVAVEEFAPAESDVEAQRVVEDAGHVAQ